MIIKRDGKEFYTNKELTKLNKDEFVYVENNSELFYKIINNFPYITLEIQDDKLINVVIEEEKIEENNIKLKLENEIIELKRNLCSTDYQAIKYVEEQISEEEYRPIKEQRQAWRDRINELETMLEVESDG